MAYNKTVWVNNSAPFIDATNLNKIEDGIYEAHGNLLKLVATKEVKSGEYLRYQAVEIPIDATYSFNPENIFVSFALDATEIFYDAWEKIGDAYFFANLANTIEIQKEANEPFPGQNVTIKFYPDGTLFDFSHGRRVLAKALPSGGNWNNIINVNDQFWSADNDKYFKINSYVDNTSEAILYANLGLLEKENRRVTAHNYTPLYTNKNNYYLKIEGQNFLTDLTDGDVIFILTSANPGSAIFGLQPVYVERVETNEILKIRSQFNRQYQNFNYYFGKGYKTTFNGYWTGSQIKINNEIPIDPKYLGAYYRITDTTTGAFEEGWVTSTTGSIISKYIEGSLNSNINVFVEMWLPFDIIVGEDTWTSLPNRGSITIPPGWKRSNLYVNYFRSTSNFFDGLYDSTANSSIENLFKYDKLFPVFYTNGGSYGDLLSIDFSQALDYRNRYLNCEPNSFLYNLPGYIQEDSTSFSVTKEIPINFERYNEIEKYISRKVVKYEGGLWYYNDSTVDYSLLENPSNYNTFILQYKSEVWVSIPSLTNFSDYLKALKTAKEQNNNNVVTTNSMYYDSTNDINKPIIVIDVNYSSIFDFSSEINKIYYKDAFYLKINNYFNYYYSNNNVYIVNVVYKMFPKSKISVFIKEN